MKRRTLLLALPALSACSPGLTLAAFDTFAPRDPGATQIARNASFGPHRRQKLDLYAPAGGGENLPIVMFIHGGSWRYGDKSGYNFLGAAFASQGFLTAIPNYRLVPEVRFPSFIEDCAAAVRWLGDNAAAHGGDAGRIVVVGHSAGAYNAVMLALDPAYLAAAGAPIPRGVVGLAGPYDFIPFDVPATQNAFGQAAEARLTQPVHFARAGAPPLLLLWGRDDATVGPRNIESLDRAMRAAGGAVESKIYPGIDHIEIMAALSRPYREKAPVLEDITNFTRRLLG